MHRVTHCYCSNPNQGSAPSNLGGRAGGQAGGRAGGRADGRARTARAEPISLTLSRGTTFILYHDVYDGLEIFDRRSPRNCFCTKVPGRDAPQTSLPCLRHALVCRAERDTGRSFLMTIRPHGGIGVHLGQVTARETVTERSRRCANRRAGGRAGGHTFFRSRLSPRLLNRILMMGANSRPFAMILWNFLFLYFLRSRSFSDI
jgi:hypothetical protein